VDSLEKRAPSGSWNTRRFEDLICIRKGLRLYDSASVAAKARRFEDL
jgi:hypothetical protein